MSDTILTLYLVRDVMSGFIVDSDAGKFSERGTYGFSCF